MSADGYTMENRPPNSKDLSDTEILTELCDWLLEMRSLDETVEGALHLEPFREKDGSALKETCWDARLEYLRESARLHLVTPFLQKHSTSQEKANARLMLPSFFDSICALLIKTWHLAQARERHVKQLTGGYIERVQLCRQAEAGSDKAELESVRKALKEKCFELACAQKNIQQADQHRQTIEQLLKEVERGKQQETRTRMEAERRLTGAQAKATSEAKQREGEYHSRLMEAREALKQAHEALDEARTGLEVAEQRRMQGEEHSSQLERALAACQQQLHAVLMKQRVTPTPAPHPGGGPVEFLRARSTSPAVLVQPRHCLQRDMANLARYRNSTPVISRTTSSPSPRHGRTSITRQPSRQLSARCIPFTQGATPQSCSSSPVAGRRSLG